MGKRVMLFGGGAPLRFRLWSLEEDAALRALANQGKSSRAIAAFLNERFARHISQGAVLGRCARTGIRLSGTPGNPNRRNNPECPHRLWNKEEDAALMEVAGQGRSAKEIAALLSTQFHRTFTRNAVIGRSHRIGVCLAGKSAGNPLGFNGRTHQFSEEESATLAILVAEQQLSLKLIADIMGISHWAIRRQCNKLGLVPLGRSGRWQHADFARAPKERRDPKNRGPSKNRELPIETPNSAAPLIELGDLQCRWPVDGAANSLFCGAEVVRSNDKDHPYPYCEKHCSRAYVAR